MADDPKTPSDSDDELTISAAGGPASIDAITLSREEADRELRAAKTPPSSIAGYRILGKLGQGGMGVVWEAEQAHPKRRVALKVLRGDHVVDDYHARMFDREAESLARLKHPNIAAIYESGHTDDGHPYFAMELVQGERLDRWLASRPEVVDAAELELRLHLFTTMCEAVHYAHQRGVILYEILSGAMPYEINRAAIAEAVRVICEDAPTSLRTSFRGARRLDPDYRQAAADLAALSPDSIPE